METAVAQIDGFAVQRAADIEVTEVRMFRLPDYLIRVQVADAASYERWLTNQLLGDPPSPVSTPA